MKCTAGVAADMREAVLITSSFLQAVPFSDAPSSAGSPRSLALWLPSSSGHLNQLEDNTVAADTSTLGDRIRTRDENVGYRGGRNWSK